MTKEEFINEIRENITAYLPSEYAGYTVRIEEVCNGSRAYTGLSLIDPRSAGTFYCTPCLNLDELYENEKPQSQSDVASMVVYIVYPQLKDAAFKADALEHAFSGNPDMLHQFDSAREKMILRILSEKTKESKTGLDDFVYRDHGELSVSPSLYVPVGDDGGFIQVTKKMCSDWGVSEEEVFRAASENMAVNYKMKELKMDPMTVITEPETLSAGIFFAEGVMDRLAEKYGDYFILPSSTHEFILISGDTYKDMSVTPEDLNNMVAGINRSVVDPADRCSNECYHYDAAEKIFETGISWQERLSMQGNEKTFDRKKPSL